MANITKRTVDAVASGERDIFLWDSELAGFGLKVTPAGRKVYLYQYRQPRPGNARGAPTKRYTIGQHGQVTADQARKMAKDLAALVVQGIDPREREVEGVAAKVEASRIASERVRLESQLAFDKIAAAWLDHYENEMGRRPSSLAMARLVVNRYLAPMLASKPLPHINRADLQPILDAIPTAKRGIRRAVFAYASILFGWAHKRGDITDNPLAAMAKPGAPKARDRVLADDELAEIWQASLTLGDMFGSFFRLLILTGQRRSEVSGIGWAELDRSSATWIIPTNRAKNGSAHIVPLSDAAVAELDRLALAEHVKAKELASDTKRWPKSGLVLTTTGRTPISGITKAKAALDEAVAKARADRGQSGAMPGWRIHDLRRTMATGFQRLGVRFEVTEATLNHISGSKGGVAGIYQRHDWADEKRTALGAWARHVAGILQPAEIANVVLLRTGA
jgi:integrase